MTANRRRHYEGERNCKACGGNLIDSGTAVDRGSDCLSGVASRTDLHQVGFGPFMAYPQRVGHRTPWLADVNGLPYLGNKLRCVVRTAQATNTRHAWPH